MPARSTIAPERYDDPLVEAVERAIELRETIVALEDPATVALVEAILFLLGERLAKRTGR